MKYKAKYLQLMKQSGGMNAEVREEGGADGPPIAPAPANMRKDLQNLKRLFFSQNRKGYMGPNVKKGIAQALFIPHAHPAQNQPTGTITVTVEALGSGAVIIPALKILGTDTYQDIRRKLDEQRPEIKEHFNYKIFKGHGGEELANRSMSSQGIIDGFIFIISRLYKDTFIKIEIIDTDGNVVPHIEEVTKKISVINGMHMKITTTVGEIYAYTGEPGRDLLLSHPNNPNVFLLIPEDLWDDVSRNDGGILARYIQCPTFFTIEGNLSFTIDYADKKCVDVCDEEDEHPNRCGNLEFNIKVNGNDLSFRMDVKSLDSVMYEDGYTYIEFDEEVSTPLSWLNFRVERGENFNEYDIDSTYNLVPITDGVLKAGDRY